MPRILVADDDAFHREMLRDLLEAAGHVVIEAADGNEALRRYRPSQIDLVLSEAFMPGKTGLELVGELRNIHPDARVIVCGSADPSELVRARNLGAIQTFEKPFSLADVIQAVEKALSPDTPLGAPPAEGGAGG